MGKRVAILGMLISAALALLKIWTGLRANSTSLISDGLESAADVFGSGLVLFGLFLAARPPDENHPYGHGRFEIVTALGIGVMLVASGVLISFRSLQRIFESERPPDFFAVWPLVISIFLKCGLWTTKAHFGRKLSSAALLADSENDLVDMISGVTALAALGLTLWRPERFGASDHIGGICVGLIVVFLGIRVIRDMTLQLVDTMPGEWHMEQIRNAAMSVPGSLGIEKCFARRTGAQYHVDLHLEVDPEMTVHDSHEIARAVKTHIREKLPWVADVLVHVEPHPGAAPGAVAKSAASTIKI